MNKTKKEKMKNRFQTWFGLVYGALTIFLLYRGCHLYWWRKPEYQEKTTDLSQFTDKFRVPGGSMS